MRCAMEILILGSGCPNCKKLEENAKKAAAELGIKAKFGKITDFEKMASYGIMSTPALVVDGEAVLSGAVPSVAELKEILGDYL